MLHVCSQRGTHHPVVLITLRLPIAAIEVPYNFQSYIEPQN